MRIFFDLRGILDSPKSSGFRMAGIPRTTLEWAKGLADRDQTIFVAPGISKTIRGALASTPEWSYLSDQIDQSEERKVDHFIADFLVGRARLSRFRHQVAPSVINHKFPNDILRFMRAKATPESPAIYFIPSVKLMPISCPDGIVPVMNVYDIIPLLFSENGSAGNREYARSIEIMRDQDGHFIVNSSYVRHNLISMFDIPLDRVHVVGLGTAVPRQKKGSIPFPGSPYFLLVSGDCQRRKNVDGTIRGFARFLDKADTDHQLRIVGPAHSHIQPLIDRYAPKWRDRIVGMGHVSDETLDSLQSSAACGLYLSLHEGFGLPPLESMKYGVPMICSNTTSIPEVVGNAALLVDPFEDCQISEAMEAIATDPLLVQTLRKRGRERSAELTWESSVSSLRGAFNQILSRRVSV